MLNVPDKKLADRIRIPDILLGFRYQQALEAARIGTWWVDMHTGMANWDPITSEIMGVSHPGGECPALYPVHPEDRAAVADSLEQSFATGSLHDVQFRPLRDGDETCWLRAIARPPAGAGPDQRWLTGVMFDITEQRETETALRESQRQLSKLLNNLPGIAYRASAQAPFTIEFASDAVLEITGYTAQEIYDDGMDWSQLMHPEDLAGVQRQIENAVEFSSSFSVRYRIIARDGTIKWVHERGEAHYDVSGQAEFLEGFIWDVTEQHAIDDRLQWAATHDGLTKLPNRILFQLRLDEALERAQQTGGHVGVLLLDLDDFKLINDTLGHDAGDALLCSVADRLSLSVDPSTTVARLSGDEFALVVEDAPGEYAIERTTSEIIAAFHNPFMHKGRLFDCHASIGVSVFPDDAKKRGPLLKDADIALYAAKAEGGGRLKYFEPRMRSEMEDRSTMLRLAREALSNHWIVPYYQPKVDLNTGKVEGFEALLRWEHPQLGIQTPEAIAAAFQDLDLAASISDRMIALVIADVDRWTKAGIDFGHVAINAAAAEFRRGNFAEMLLDRLAKAKVDPAKFQIEVTETVFLGRGAEYVESALKRLSSAGMTVALDDFGTGYASLSHLKQFPVDIIKIDRSFVGDLQADQDDEAIVRAVISLGKSLGIRIVAEGVETASQAEYLRKYGCDFGQGYLFGAAVAADDLPAALASVRSTAYA